MYKKKTNKLIWIRNELMFARRNFPGLIFLSLDIYSYICWTSCVLKYKISMKCYFLHLALNMLFVGQNDDVELLRHESNLKAYIMIHNRQTHHTCPNWSFSNGNHTPVYYTRKPNGMHVSMRKYIFWNWNINMIKSYFGAK